MNPREEFLDGVECVNDAFEVGETHARAGFGIVYARSNRCVFQSCILAAPLQTCIGNT